jgi:GNAT superfamily N-acetyltransferase
MTDDVVVLISSIENQGKMENKALFHVRDCTDNDIALWHIVELLQSDAKDSAGKFKHRSCWRDIYAVIASFQAGLPLCAYTASGELAAFLISAKVGLVVKIEFMFTAPSFRRRGAAKLLFQHLEKMHKHVEDTAVMFQLKSTPEGEAFWKNMQFVAKPCWHKWIIDKERYFRLLRRCAQ